MMPSGPHSSTMGTGEAVTMSTVVLRLCGHDQIVPMLVEDQSKAAMSVFISLSGIGGEASESSSAFQGILGALTTTGCIICCSLRRRGAGAIPVQAARCETP